MREADIGSHPPLPDRAQNLAESEEHDDLISIYDPIDEYAVSGYEGLEEATQAANRQPQTANDYDRLGATQPADTDKSTEHVEMSELGADNNDQDAVSKLF